MKASRFLCCCLLAASAHAQNIIGPYEFAAQGIPVPNVLFDDYLWDGSSLGKNIHGNKYQSELEIGLQAHPWSTRPYASLAKTYTFEVVSFPFDLPQAWYGNALAGYSSYPSFQGWYWAVEGIRHTYFIDRNIDLTTINPYERVIYNPSEATITANNLVFPECYTFKTIRGAYPTAAEAIAANTKGNGGSYSQLQSVPVPTDLGSSYQYPDGVVAHRHAGVNVGVTPVGTYDACNASVYHVTNGAKLTIKPSTVVYDATFVVEPGGTLTYYPERIRGRYQIVSKCGTPTTADKQQTDSGVPSSGCGTVIAIPGGSYPDCSANY